MDYRIELPLDGRLVPTLADILPERGPLRMLIVGKTPSPASVETGHYFQGRMGRGLWKRLDEAEVLRPVPGLFPDELLLEQGFGLTDICKLPRPFGEEPSEEEYREGWERVGPLLTKLRPRVLAFVYKGALDKVLRYCYGWEHKSCYGFNDDLMRTFGRRVFAVPLPGVACTAREARRYMQDLGTALNVR